MNNLVSFEASNPKRKYDKIIAKKQTKYEYPYLKTGTFRNQIKTETTQIVKIIKYFLKLIFFLFFGF